MYCIAKQRNGEEKPNIGICVLQTVSYIYIKVSETQTHVIYVGIEYNKGNLHTLYR